MYSRLVRSRLLLWTVGVVLIFVATGLAFVSTLPLKAEQLEGARREGQLMAVALGEQLSATFRSSNASVVSLAKYFESVGGPHGISWEQARAALLREASDDVGTQAIFLMDAAGDVVASSKLPAAWEEADAQTRESFAHHARHPQDASVHVQTPSFSNTTSTWVLPISRGIFDARGRLQGILLVYLNLSHIKSMAELMGSLRSAMFTFLGRDGVIFFRYPGFERAVNLRLSEYLELADAWNQPGSIDMRSPFDGVERVASYRRAEAFPAMVVVGYPRDEVLAGWTRLAWERTLLTFFCTLAVVVALALAQRAFIRSSETRQLIEAEVQVRTRRLQQANQDLEDLSFNASQDLSQPLRQIRNVLDESREHVSAGAVELTQNLVTRVSDAATRMERLIGEMQVFSNASRAPLKLRDCDIGHLAHSVVDELQKAHRHRSVQVTVEPEMYATVDAQLALMLLRELLGNAWKFTAGKPDARVSIEMRRGPWENVFVVRDNGVGFDNEEARRIFQPFQRLSTAKGTVGNGMGLPTVQRIVQRHGGRIWVRGKVGEGAAIFFTLQPAVNPLDRSVVLPAWVEPQGTKADIAVL
ncbi:MAG: hypothetical protein J7549_06435 [Variovorax sp.]|nr:hypothetical protein [Variovorax sp.]